MNKKEIRYGTKMVIDAASRLECEDLHHKPKHKHREGVMCPAKYELDKYIQMVSQHMDKVIESS